MFSIAVIVFREVLEISLILGVLLAATRGLPNRAPWVWLGLLLGMAGAGMVAFFADAISQAAEGMGQEMMNATILFIAAILIGWTIVWMNRNARELTQHFKKIGVDVIKGIKPKYTLTIVVALSVLREGSEVVMFIYSALVTGGKTYLLITGSLLGTCMGMMAGVVIYYGLMKIPIKKVLIVTSWLLMLLVAGMVAQAFGYLSAVGKIPDLIPVVWDTSRIISDGSLLGKIMHILVGYTDRPSGIQLLVYFLTIGVLWVAVKTVGQPTNLKKNILLMVIGLIGLFGLSHPAFAEKHVYSPIIEQGEIEFETTGTYDLDHSKEKNAVQEYKNAIGYGVTERWATELYGEFERQPQQNGDGTTHLSSVKFTHLEWENRYQLTEQGQYWLDAGIYFAYEIPMKEKDPGKIEGKILLEKSTQQFTHTANIIFNKEVGGGTTQETDAGFAWSSRYRLSKYFQPGFEYWIDFGEINKHRAFNEQHHQIGPAFYGFLMPHVKYDIGYLFGMSKAAPAGELKWILEYELRF